MSEPYVSPLATSVRQRLLNLAKAQGEEFQRTLMRYAMERLLYCLSLSEHADRFVLKGALLFWVWTHALHRATKDLDLLGKGDPSVQGLEEIAHDLCRIVVPDDGLTFLAETVTVSEIREETEYGGLRVQLLALLGNARIPVQIDVGFGDIITPAAQEVEFPVLLPQQAPHLRAYPKETVVAEKFEAMTPLGLDNSRLKDFYDLYTLAQKFAFEGPTVVAAMTATFKRRGTPLPITSPVALTNTFAEDPSKQIQWAAFVRRSGLTQSPPPLTEVIALLRVFLLPAMVAAQKASAFSATWLPCGPWK